MDFDFADILLETIRLDASDLHISVGSPPAVRVRGDLKRLDYPVMTSQDTREIIYTILSNDQRKRLETDWQVDLSYTVPNQARFRVNAYVQSGAICAASLLIPSELKSIDELGLPSVLHEFVKKPRGFVLVTGPTGSGKSTSLASMV